MMQPIVRRASLAFCGTRPTAHAVVALSQVRRSAPAIGAAAASISTNPVGSSEKRGRRAPSPPQEPPASSSASLPRGGGTIRRDGDHAPFRRHHPHPPRRRCLSTFTPPPPNAYRGESVYPDVDLSPPVRATEAALARNSDPEAVFVVTGASRSMGLQFVRELLSRTEGRVAACVLRPGSTPTLDKFLGGLSSDDRSRVCVYPLDVTDDDRINQLTTELTETYGRVDGLFNVAGVLGDRKSTPGPEMSLAQIDKEWFSHSLQVNAVGPIMLTKALMPLLKARKGLKKQTYLRATGARESVVVNISARVASLSDNDGLPPWHTYRISKAALNQAVRTSSHELKRHGVWTLALYPGMVDTDMSRPFQTDALRKSGKVFPVEFSVGQMMDVVDASVEEHSGGFYDWAGLAIPF